MGVTVQWLKFSLNKFRERFKIREIREIKDPRSMKSTKVQDPRYIPRINARVLSTHRSAATPRSVLATTQASCIMQSLGQG